MARWTHGQLSMGGLALELMGSHLIRDDSCGFSTVIEWPRPKRGCIEITWAEDAAMIQSCHFDRNEEEREIQLEQNIAH
ncbi:hypothetical protein [Luteibaculum oceani]|uniref:Uncharacterized protein n=1 Tax=Luteibaculum oceani TaxID=1294296 RepID=A0A5C6V7Y9_9FLAO|nr:hypothetical protein [Luteibaculum oceani]TXC81393.1 hypothetical protein FRX97_05145 [Luteibaculum oceani]